MHTKDRSFEAAHCSSNPDTGILPTNQVSRRQYALRVCPVCLGSEVKQLFQQSFDMLTRARLLDGYNLVACQTCGTCFASDIPPQGVFDAYYRDLSKYDYENSGGQEPPGSQQRVLEILETVIPFIPKRDCRILEIGCGSGKFLGGLRDRGFSDVTGVDPSVGCARSASQLYGVSVSTGTIFDIPPPTPPKDFLVLIGVMEHIRDLDAAVAQISMLLQEHGRVYLEVPDASRFQARFDAPFQEFSVEHINFFSAASLTNLMNTRGFRAVASGSTIRPQYEVCCPAAYGIYEKSPQRTPWQRDLDTEIGLQAYIRDCAASDQHLRSEIDRATSRGGKIIVWGVGAHTLRLLATGGLDPGRIALFVDSSPHYQNQELRGIPVVSPEEMRQRPEPILISSRGFQQEIRYQIQHEMRLPNPLILLYPSEPLMSE